MPFHKFVHRIKDGKRKTDIGQIFKMEVNLWPYSYIFFMNASGPGMMNQQGMMGTGGPGGDGGSGLPGGPGGMNPGGPGMQMQR